MFDFLRKSAPPQPAAANIDELVRQLAAATKAQYTNGNITAADLQKLVALANNSARLRTALTYL